MNKLLRFCRYLERVFALPLWMLMFMLAGGAAVYLRTESCTIFVAAAVTGVLFFVSVWVAWVDGHAND
jgi:hypothetical protein